MTTINSTILHAAKAREALVEGTNDLANAVKVTLGPLGLNVVLGNNTKPVATKDGVSVARAIELENPWTDIAAKLIKDVAIKAEQNAGDGTTTATVLAQAMVNMGMDQVRAGRRPIVVLKELERVVEHAKAELTKMRMECASYDDLYQVAMVSSDGDEIISKTCAEIISKVGKFGMVEIKKGFEDTDRTVMTNGYVIPRGVFTPQFYNRSDNTWQHDNVLLMCTQDTIRTENEVVAALQTFAERDPNGQYGWVMMADDFDEVVVGRFHAVSMQRGMSICLVKSPSAGSTQAGMLEDLAVIGGGQVLPLGTLKAATEGKVGQEYVCEFKNVRMQIDSTSVDYVADPSDHVAHLQAMLPTLKTGYERERYNERIARLTGGIVTLQVGGKTEAERDERYDHYDDAIKATQAALRQGTVIGGGYALVRVVASLQEASWADNVLLVPFTQILLNGEYSQQEIDDHIENFIHDNQCLDVYSDEYIPAPEYRIVDPYAVTVSALETAFSIAKLVVRTGALVGKSSRRII